LPRLSRRAGGLGVGREAVAHRDQQAPQLLALVVVERGEQLVLGVLLRAGSAGEVAFAGPCEGDEVAAAVVGVALAGDQSVGFERVQERDEDASRHRRQR
jgi:hypothetical protein